MTPAMLYLRRSRFFRSITTADIAVFLLRAFTANPDQQGTASTFFAYLASGVVVFIAAYVGFEKWCQHKGWGKLSDYPETRRKKHLRWLLNLSAYSLINILLIRVADVLPVEVASSGW